MLCRRNAAQQAARELVEAQDEVRRVQEVRAGSSPRSEAAEVSVRALLLAGAYPLIPADKVPKSVSPGSLYGEFTPVTLMQGVGDAGAAALQLGSAALKAVARGLGIGDKANGSAGEEGGAPAENGVARTASQDVNGRPGSAVPVAPSPTAAAAAAAAAGKPRRQPPPPPPKML